MLPEPTLNVAAPASLADFTHPDLIVPEVRERDTAGIIGELSQVLQRHGEVTDVLPLYHTALNRELLSSSAVECGLAFPHARLSGLKQLRFALGRAPVPVSWCGKGSWPVRLVFLVAIPATDATGYLHLLSCLARLGQEPGQVAQLLDAESAEQIISVLSRSRIRTS